MPTTNGCTITRITGGVAVYAPGSPQSPAHAVRIFATTTEARQWAAAR